MSSESVKLPSRGPLVLIELGNDWLKMIQAERTRGGVTVTRLHIERVEESGSALARAIGEACRRLKFARGPYLVAVPRQMVNIRVIRLPSTDSEEIADMVDLQVGKQTPYAREQIVSDFRILDSSAEGYSRVMLAIIQRDVLRDRYYILEEAGIDPARMTVTTEGLLAWYAQGTAHGHKDGQTTAGLDMDAAFSDFVVASGKGLAFTRSILIGAEQLRQDYSRAKERLVREMRQSLESFHAENPDATVGRLVLSGAASRMQPLATDLASDLGLPVDVADAIADVREMPAAPSLSEPGYADISMTPLVGMAMAANGLSINLVPESVRLKKRLSEKAKGLTMLAALLMAVLIAGSLLTTLLVSLRQHYRDTLRNERAGIQEQVRRVEQMRELVRLVRERGDPSHDALVLLTEIHRQVPASVFFDQMDLDVANGRVILQASAESRSDIGSLIVSLEKSPLFKEVRESNSRVDSRSRRLRFQVSATVEGRP